MHVTRFATGTGLRTLLVATLTLGLMAALGAGTAWAKPLKVESENIVLYGDVKPEFATDFVRQMELYRRMIFTLAGKDGAPPDPQKLTIHGFESVRDVQRFAGRDNIAGIYTDGVNGPVFLSPIRKRKRGSDWANKVGLHEYSHHVLHAVVVDRFPYWYNEGFAEYLSTLQITDERITIGAPTAQHAENFNPRLGWLDPGVVLRAINGYPSFNGNKRAQEASLGQFYAQSWLYVHYMQSHPELGSKLPNYLAALKRGTQPIRAFEESYGMSVADFHALAEKYWDNNAFGVVAFAPQGNFLEVDVRATDITADALALAEVRGQVPFLNDENVNSFAKRVERAIAAYPDDPFIQAARADALVRQERYAEAERVAEAALAAAPDDLGVVRTLSDARFHRLQEGGANASLSEHDLRPLPTGPAFDTMVRGFERVLETAPRDEIATTHMLSAYAFSDAPLTEAARQAMGAVEDAMLTPDPGTALELAAFQLRDGRAARACRYFNYANTAARNMKSKDRKRIQARLDHVTAMARGQCAGTGS